MSAAVEAIRMVAEGERQRVRKKKEERKENRKERKGGRREKRKNIYIKIF